jgi:23S rRNA (uracil747-C5)-methyltransferase
MHCEYFDKKLCQSCSLLDLRLEETLDLKEQSLKKLFINYRPIYQQTVRLDKVEHSRTKAKLACFLKDGVLTFGYVDANLGLHELEHCPLHADGINDLLPILKANLSKYSISPYDLQSKKGELKFLIISKSSGENQFLIRFVLRSKESLDRLKKMALELEVLLPQIKVMSANIQPEHKAILEGEEEIVLTKSAWIIHQFDEFKLALGARSFFQVSPEIAKKLYFQVSEQIRMDKPSSLLDLFCGVGAFAFYASKWCQKVFGVEISKEAIECAKHSVELNGKKITFSAFDVEKFLSKNQERFEAVIVNPPRRGLNEKIIDQLFSIDPKFIYYSSCNAETLLLDTHKLTSRYELKSLQIFDMFPHTSHYETLAVFHRHL